MKHKRLPYYGTVGDRISLPWERMQREIKESFAGKEIRVIVTAEKVPKTLKQINAFHGPVRQQVQAYYQEVEGVFRSLDRIKNDLKEEFLLKRPQYYDDGSPVMVRTGHPEKKGVFFEYHLHTVPSLAELSIEEMNDFITAIIEDFTHKKGWSIIIEEKEEVNN